MTVDRDGGTSSATHVPRPREHELPYGGLAVSSHWVHGVRDVTAVSAEDLPLYRLLMDILADENVPDTMPARMASECKDLVDVKHAVEDIERGRTDIGGRGYGLSFLYRVRDAIEAHRDRGPITLAAVGCSASKFGDEDPLAAKDRYKGSYWSAKRDYGQDVADSWRIISAEYGLLDPEKPIPDYDTTIDDLAGVPIDDDGRLPSGDRVDTLLDRWAHDVYHGLAAWIGDVAGGIDPRDVRLEVLLGRNYRDALEERGVLDLLPVPAQLEIAYPFQEEADAQGGMIQQIGWMGDEVEAVQEEPSHV